MIELQLGGTRLFFSFLFSGRWVAVEHLYKPAVIIAAQHYLPKIEAL